MMQKGFSILIVLLGIIVLTAVAAGTYYLSKLKTSEPRICTMDAKICPDGSSVGRSGPNCEFAPCPATKPSPSPASTDEIANWKTFQNNVAKFSLKLPQEMVVVGVGMGPPEAEDAGELIICKNCVNTVNPSNTPSIYIRTTELKYTIYKNTPFDDLVKQNYEANIANKNNTRSVVKGLQQINFAEEKAFTYTLDSSGYSGKSNGFATYSGINRIIEMEHNGIFFVLIYPQDQTFDLILSTFKFLPTTADGDQDSVEGKFCGGIAGNLPENQCPTGYRCQLDGNYPDAGGKCVKS